MYNFDPLSIFALIVMQIGSRHFNIEFTQAQKKILKHPIIQILIFLTIIYFSTRDIYISIIILFICYLFIYVLFNENSKFNILSKVWLKKEGIINDKDITSYKEIYHNNLNKILYN